MKFEATDFPRLNVDSVSAACIHRIVTQPPRPRNACLMQLSSSNYGSKYNPQRYCRACISKLLAPYNHTGSTFTLRMSEFPDERFFRLETLTQTFTVNMSKIWVITVPKRRMTRRRSRHGVDLHKFPRQCTRRSLASRCTQHTPDKRVSYIRSQDSVCPGLYSL